MRDQYDSLESPKAGIMPNDKYEKTVSEVTKALGQLNSTIRSADQKVSLFGTSLDSQSNHEQLHELLDRGENLIAKIDKRIKLLTDDVKGQSGAVVKARSTVVKKLTADFKTQTDLFNQSTQKAKAASSYVPPPSTVPAAAAAANPLGAARPAQNNAFSNFNEDHILAQAQVTTYHEEDEVRREQDIIHINHQLREINAAYKEVDGLINDQHEVVVEIAGNVDNAQDNAHRALEQVQEADAKRKYCGCSKRKMWCYGIIILLFLGLVIGLIAGLSRK
ncbi:hypothetical protein LEN26_005682 [Aphanomyces euteiches]|nr:hypothetical protein LEN26_005682 [Aphanomyces euteiches]